LDSLNESLKTVKEVAAARYDMLVEAEDKLNRLRDEHGKLKETASRLNQLVEAMATVANGCTEALRDDLDCRYGCNDAYSAVAGLRDEYVHDLDRLNEVEGQLAEMKRRVEWFDHENDKLTLRYNELLEQLHQADEALTAAGSDPQLGDGAEMALADRIRDVLSRRGESLANLREVAEETKRQRGHAVDDAWAALEDAGWADRTETLGRCIERMSEHRKQLRGLLEAKKNEASSLRESLDRVKTKLKASEEDCGAKDRGMRNLRKEAMVNWDKMVVAQKQNRELQQMLTQLRQAATTIIEVTQEGEDE
jgi:chromosome segregation ATPase